LRYGFPACGFSSKLRPPIFIGASSNSLICAERICLTWMRRIRTIRARLALKKLPGKNLRAEANSALEKLNLP